MQYQSDYVLRLIEQMGGLVRRAIEMLRHGGEEEPYVLAEEAIGLALDVSPDVAARLSPQSMTALLEMRNVDDRVIELVAQSLELQHEVLQRNGEMIVAGVRKQQAEAVRSLLDPSRAN